MNRKLDTIFSKDKKIHCILLFVVAVCFLSITTVYSALYTTMDISGTAYARVEADVRITDFRLASANNATSSFEEFGKSHVVTEVDLIDNTSSITYYLEITNYGSVDIGIFDITGLPEGVNYSIKDYNLRDKICDDTGKCNSFITKTYEVTLTTTNTYSGSVQLNFDFRTYHSITYTSITNNGYPVEVIDGGDLVITFNENLKRVQVLSGDEELGYYSIISNGEEIIFNNITSDLVIKLKPKVARLIQGNIEDVGSEVCIGSECFYIISYDGETVTLLSKYNLLVGNIANSNNTPVPLDNPTGRQDSTARGFLVSGYPYIGTTLFASSSHQGVNLSDYEGSIVKDYVDEYSAYLNGLGVILNNARLITYDELLNLGCSSEDNTCSEERSWLYSTSYWTMSVYDESHVWNVSSRNLLGTSGTDYAGYLFGVRPVIELSVDEIKTYVEAYTGDIDRVGSEVCINEECFYTISSDSDSITMLSKYNLYVGGVFTVNSVFVPYGSEATGIQDPSMLGWYANDKPRDGVISFSGNPIYWSSTVSSYPANVFDSNSRIYPYLVNYRGYIDPDNSFVKDIRLITYEELDSLGCSISNERCNSNTPKFVYSTTYWTGTASDGQNVYRITSDGRYGTNTGSGGYSGVRPVIEIPKWAVMDTILFTIDGVTYYAKNGMSFSDWLDSEYNTFTYYDDTFYVSSGSTIHLNAGDGYYLCNSADGLDYVYATDKIVKGYSYYVVSRAK